MNAALVYPTVGQAHPGIMGRFLLFESRAEVGFSG